MGYTVAIIADGTQDDGAQLACKALTQAGHEAHALTADETLASELRALRPHVALPLMADPESVCDLLDLLQIPFVGTPAPTRRLLADATALTDLLARTDDGMPQAAHVPATACVSARALRGLGVGDVLDLVAERIPSGYPLCVSGAHAGVAGPAIRVEDAQGLRAALEEALAHDELAIVRPLPEGAFLAVPVLGDIDDLTVLPPAELSALAGEVLHAPVRLASLSHDEADAQAVRSEVERAALDAYLASGARDLACVLLAWDGAQAQVLGIDLAPSLAAGAPLPQALAAADIALDDLLDALVGIAADRGPEPLAL